MFIAIVGTPFSGKSSIEEYLVSLKGFTSVRLLNDNETETKLNGNQPIISEDISNTNSYFVGVSRYPQQPVSEKENAMHFSFLSMTHSPLSSPRNATWEKTGQMEKTGQKPLCFSSPSGLLDFVTRHWRSNFVTVDLCTNELVESFVKRPFFMLISVDAPLWDRFQRSRPLPISLESFVREHDRSVFGANAPLLNSSSMAGSRKKHSSLHNLSDHISLTVHNTFPSIPALYTHLDSLDLLNPNRLRPEWDTYFMTLASLASHRSNCMKRRVGAILVRNNRIVATGYNGTPRGLINCNEGGCSHCNGTLQANEMLLECVCLHAEENAILEAGKDRIGDGAVLYCNTCPCLKCTVKIIQAGVKEVVYNLSYKVDDASAELLNQAGVEFRRHDPKKQTANINLKACKISDT